MKLMPFFTFYGGKWRSTPHYPEPQHGTIVEPFAGSAGYSLNYADRNVKLYDLDPVIVGTWRYLLAATPDEIVALPDLEPGQSVDDVDVPQAARWLIGWWLNKGSATPKLRPSTFMLSGVRPKSCWGPEIRERIAGQLEHIRHWTVDVRHYDDGPHYLQATWFVDPPYVDAGRYYRFGSREIDYCHLAEWVKTRRGQVIVCENEGADWLPFRRLIDAKGTEGRQKLAAKRTEVIYP